MEKIETSRINSATETAQHSAEIRALGEPIYPVLDVTEFPNMHDLRDQLPAADQAELRQEEVVVHIHHHELRLPRNSVTPLDIVMKAARARMPEEIGFMGPTVASVDVSGKEEISRYERQHGRDDLIAGEDLKDMYPQLLDTVVVSLASTQGMETETFIPGQPYGFEKPGSIILVDFSKDDPLGQKFQTRKDWRLRFYGSADAPGLFVDAIANLQAVDPQYLHKRSYTATDGNTYGIGHALDLSVQWLTDHMNANAEGLIEYRNPYTNGRGMRNQGWKDSADAIVHKNGEWANANGGIAPIEIQCQAVISLRKAANIYRTVQSNEAKAAELEARAANLLDFILKNGWVQDERGGYFATGWDRDENGRLRRIESRSIDMHSVLRVLDMSDPSQKEMARSTVRTLASEEMFTRWGSRVMSANEVAYGDLRYHCGVWPDKSNRVAESVASIGLHGLDRAMGARTTRLINLVGCVPEHISGKDSELPAFPTKDLYVYNQKYHELHLAEQIPPLGQTWGATSELAKKYRYSHTPKTATDPGDQQFEAEIIAGIAARY